jgi:hypothetical protein
MHFCAASPDTFAPELPDVENTTKADEDAWAQVNPGDLHSVERYLSQVPGAARVNEFETLCCII